MLQGMGCISRRDLEQVSVLEMMDVFIIKFVVMISRRMHRFKFIKLYTLNKRATFYVKYTLIKLKNK